MKDEITVAYLFEQTALSRQERWTIAAQLAKEIIDAGKCIRVFYSPMSATIVVEEIKGCISDS